ncbi:MAG: hypothetical protein ACTSXM_06745, partial [Promethearchaeota archaeon]
HSSLVLLDLKHNFEWFTKDKKLIDNLNFFYKPNLLKSDYYDHLGDMYAEKILPLNPSKWLLTPLDLTNKLANDIVNERSQLSFKLLDSMVGSGRLLMAIFKKAPDSLLFGVDNDIRVLRIAQTNFFIHNIPALLLNADSAVHETDIAKPEGYFNWQYANRWHSHKDKLKPKETVYSQTQKMVYNQK